MQKTFKIIKKIKKCILLFSMFTLFNLSTGLYANNIFNNHYNAMWIFFGKLKTDNDEIYNLAFEFTKLKKNQYSLKLKLQDIEKNQLIINQTIDNIIIKRNKNEWPMTDAFVGFNPINNKWLINLVETKQNPGIHLNIELQNKALHNYNNNIIAGKSAMITGNIKNKQNNNDQFVSGNNAKYIIIKNILFKKNNTDINSFVCNIDSQNAILGVKIKNKNRQLYLSGWENNNKLKLLSGIINPIEKNNKIYIFTKKPKFSLIVTKPENNSDLKNFIGNADNNRQNYSCFFSKQEINS